MNRFAEPSGKLGEHLSRFKDLVVADATVIRLRNALPGAYAACRTNHTRAVMKLHLVMCVLGVGARKVTITGEHINEPRQLGIGPSVAGRRQFFDLGYFKWQLFTRIHENGGFFVSRQRDDASPVIVAENRRWRGASHGLAGERLGDVKAGLAREVVDVLVEVEFMRHSYLGRVRRERAIFRVVGVRHGTACKHRGYVTNVPVTMLSTQGHRHDLRRVLGEGAGLPQAQVPPADGAVPLGSLRCFRGARLRCDDRAGGEPLPLARSEPASRPRGGSPSAALPTRWRLSRSSWCSPSCGSRPYSSSAVDGILYSQEKAPTSTSGVPP